MRAYSQVRINNRSVSNYCCFGVGGLKAPPVLYSSYRTPAHTESFFKRGSTNGCQTGFHVQRRERRIPEAYPRTRR